MMDEVELLRSVTTLEILVTLVMALKEVIMGEKDHAMWLDILNTTTYETILIADSVANICVTRLMSATPNVHIIQRMTLSISTKGLRKFRIILFTN